MVFEVFDDFILGSTLGQGASVLSGLGSKTTIRPLDPAELTQWGFNPGPQGGPPPPPPEPGNR